MPAYRRLVPAAAALLGVLPAAAAAEAAEVVEEAPLPSFEMTVIGTRSERPSDETTAATEVIDRKEIDASGARDLADLLALRANVQVSQGVFGSTLQLHGMDPEHVLVLVDGQRMAGRKNGSIDLSRIPLDSVARIEIVRGPASALYGSDAMGGVIHVVTRRAGRPFEADGELRYGERNTLELNGSVAGRGSAGLLRVTAGLRRADAYQLEDRSVATTGSAWDETHVLVRGETELADGLALDGTASWSLRKTDAVDVGAGGAVYDRTGQLENLSFSLRPSLALAEGAHLRFTVEGTWLHEEQLSDQRGDTALDKVEEAREQVWNLGAQSELELERHFLVIGTELLLERMESDRIDGVGARNRLGLYAQDEWRVTDDLRIAPGLRFDLQEGTDPQPAPRIALRCDPVETVELRASWGMAWRAPSFQELMQLFENGSVGYVVQGNPDLKPETSHGGTLGAAWKPTRAFGLEVEVFRHEIDDLIAAATVREPSAGSPRIFSYVNVDRALTQGMETTVRVRATRALRFQAGYAFTDARDRDTGLQLEGRANHRLSGSAIWSSFESGTEASVRGSWVGERPLDGLDDERVWASGYLDLSVHVRQSIAEGFALLAGGRNLLDAGNVETLPIAPRTFYGGVAFRY